jgi:hypothetical protein
MLRDEMVFGTPPAQFARLNVPPILPASQFEPPVAIQP